MLTVSEGKLTEDEINATEAGRYGDGGGLYLTVRPSGARSWSYVYRVGARTKEIGLGSAAGAGREGVSIDHARERAADLREKRRDGKDPLQAKRDEQAAAAAVNSRMTFGEFARLHIEQNIIPGFRGAKTGNNWLRSIEIHAKSLLPMRPNDIAMAHIEDVLRPIWQKKAKTAAELRGRIERILDAAKVKGLRSGDNPACWRGGLREIMPRLKRREKHHAAADYKEVPTIVGELRTDVSEFDLSRIALEFTILTAVRTTETRGMIKREVNVKSATWVIPPERMKMEKAHRVPLSARALEIFKTQAADIGPDDFVFPGLTPGAMLGENAMNHALQRIRPGLTVHGFRSSFRDWVSEATDYRFELGELALAHKLGNKVSQAYARSDMLEKRRPMMDDWAAFVG